MNGYVCFYNGKRTELYAASSYAAQKALAILWNIPAKRQHLIHVHLAELNGVPYVHTAS